MVKGAATVTWEDATAVVGGGDSGGRSCDSNTGSCSDSDMGRCDSGGGGLQQWWRELSRALTDGRSQITGFTDRTQARA